MSWEEIDKEFELFSRRFDYVVNALCKVYFTSTVTRDAKFSKGLQACYIDEVKDVPTEPFLSQTINIYDKNKVSLIVLGHRYSDQSALAKRTYCLHKGVEYNYSDWVLINNRA